MNRAHQERINAVKKIRQAKGEGAGVSGVRGGPRELGESCGS